MRILTTLLFAILLCGCDAGIQRGNFTVTSSVGAALENNAGWITKFTGTPSAAPTAKNELLVGVVWLGDGFSSGSSTSHQTYISTHEMSIPTGTSRIRWDRRSDTISICDIEFDRSIGNLFVTRFQNGDISVEQIESNVQSTSTTDIVDAIKSAYPDDPEIQTLAPIPDIPD